MAVRMVNQNADVLGNGRALQSNCNAAKGLADVLRPSYGPKGSHKMLVSGAGDVKISKDGANLINEMQISHPTAGIIARTAGAQDEVAGDGTTASIMFTGEIMKQCEPALVEGCHPRLLTEGIEQSKNFILETLDNSKIPCSIKDREMLVNVAKTTLSTKVEEDLVGPLAEDCVDAIQIIYRGEELPLDLFMVETMHMRHRAGSDSRLVRGMVMDHGPRHPAMPKKLENVIVMTANVSLEYEKTEVNSQFYYNSAGQRAKLVEAERTFTDKKVRDIIDFKRKVCGDSGKTFCLINQKGIDLLSLDMLANEGIVALRRAKRRNMERVTKSCGGYAVNSTEDLKEDCLGFCEKLAVQTLGEEKYTFLEGVKNPHSCTMLVKGPNDQTINIIKEAIRDGLRTIANAVQDKCVIPGAGAFFIAASLNLEKQMLKITGKARLGRSESTRLNSSHIPLSRMPSSA
eukprot:TRINITY_DN1457_c0_g1_i1.p1 TRINITY_DN1457_c0_g1~~TRINITY_DN1457_c0_g1_i1.p1  ORF type:complete len:459 (+),score=162.32 TRINITY_DN1457_c0_g1_i1:12-1388(+)